MDALMRKLQRFWKLLFAIGALSILIGFNVFIPFATTEQITRRIAIMLLLMSAMAFIYTFTLQTGAAMINGLVLGVVRLVTAGLLAFHPLDTNITFTTLLAIYFGIEGALTLGEATRVKKIPVLWLPIFVVGVTGVGFSVLIWLGMKGASYAVISTLLAVLLAVRGAVQIFTALRFKNYKSPDEPAAVDAAPPADSAPPAPTSA